MRANEHERMGWVRPWGRRARQGALALVPSFLPGGLGAVSRPRGEAKDHTV